MQKSKIEWTDYTVNPVKGLCPVACSYCYARRMYKRFKWNPEIQYNPKAWFTGVDINDIKKPSRIFVGSTFEMFGDWVKLEWLRDTFNIVRLFPEHTFIFLTKNPKNLIKWNPFPDNCWVGISTNGNDCRSGLEDIFAPVHAKTKFVSIEPLLDYTPMDFRWVNWVIVGQQTPSSKKTTPRISWIQDILVRANDGNIPVFMKDNLRPLLDKEPGWSIWKLWQEFPAVRVNV